MKNDVFAVCISDFHIGECYGGISRSPKQLEQYQEIGDLEHGNIYVRTAFLRLLQLLPEMNHGKMIPYLIILGDMWDLAVNNTEDTFALSRRCFEHLNESKEYKSIGQVFSNVIYVPGNYATPHCQDNKQGFLRCDFELKIILKIKKNKICSCLSQKCS